MMRSLLGRGTCLALVLLVVACGGSEPRVPTTVTISPSAVALSAVGESQQLSASVGDQNGNPLAEAVISWSSSDGAVASVSSAGLVTAQGPGTADIVATAGSANATAAVSVVQTPTQLSKVSGDHQTGIAGDALGQPIVVEVSDALGHPVAGTTITFQAQGGGSLAPESASSDAEGRASTTLTTGALAGILQTVTATIPGSAVSVAFTATTTAGPPASITPAAGSNQHAAVGSQVPVRPAVSVRDARENPVGGVAVEFEVVSGGGSITGGSRVTNDNGRAEVGSWTLGSSGPNVLRATAAGADIDGNPVTFSAFTDPNAFDIEVRFLSRATSAQVEAFAGAEQKWEALLTGDVEDVAIDAAAGECDSGTPALNGTIDDVIIFATIDTIDGPGGILGQAGPCFIRDPGFLPAVGVMFFDSEDLDFIESEGLLQALILHEMAHVLGFGTLWPFQDLLADPVNLDTTAEEDPHFTGPRAIDAFNEAGGSSYTGGKVPVENAGGAGTVNSHWRESVFGNELMTGFIDTGTNPLSAISVAALADAGYSIDLSEADRYTLTAALRTGPGTRLLLTDDVRRVPIKLLDNRGRLRLLRR
ncbi:MAG TPA: Ig-like domain-containing protein [Gemmatimonadales bacterium]